MRRTTVKLCCLRIAAAAFLLGFPATPAAAGAPLFLSPRLGAHIGTTSNRFLDEREESSAYLRLAPALEAVWFGPGDGETSGSIQHQSTRFSRVGFERQEETSVQVSVWQPLRELDLSAAARAGVFRDRALPLDDSRWIQGTASVFGVLGNRLSPGLTAQATHTRFRYRTTADGSTQRVFHWTVEPELRWQVGPELTLWGGVGLEGAASNAPEDEFAGAGLSTGFDIQWHAAAAAGGWIRWSRRKFDVTDSATGDSRTDTPVASGLWGTLGLSPWLELNANFRRLNHRSTRPLEEYEEWAIEAGLSLRYDWQVNN